MRRPESVAAIVDGPDVIGYSVPTSSNGLGLVAGPSPHWRENIGSPQPTLKIVSCVRSERLNRIVRSSSTSTLLTPSNCARTAGDAPLLVTMSNECLTSAAVTGSP